VKRSRRTDALADGIPGRVNPWDAGRYTVTVDQEHALHVAECRTADAEESDEHRTDEL
jgi:hypothetical protein